MRVQLIAWTEFNEYAAEALTGHEWENDPDAYLADSLAVFAGRNCYQSWGKPNPATAKTSDYLAHIIRQGHHSLFAHASATFYIDSVSRAFLTELNTHHFLKGSTVSQRYVGPSKMGDPVIPPAIGPDSPAAAGIRAHYRSAVADYNYMVKMLIDEGAKPKAAREAARAVLPNCTPTKIVVTGNLLAWRDFLRKRWHVAADAEMREVAGAILDALRGYAPASFQDFPGEPFGKVA
ncbi:FAD-dependent thymidylate synthase [Nonomuraea roseoviolacea subsp. roseoviolacea]|uniref:FAD-dependent thymidylate synthase n=1 Tax=Nonomuraea roseoviolacea TaxID=103837 RepID=UPI0031DF73C4